MVNKKALAKTTGLIGGAVGVPLAIAYLRRGRFTASLTSESVVKGERAVHTLTLKRKPGFKGKLNISLKKKPPKTSVSFSKEKVKLSKKNPKEKVKVFVDTKFNKTRTPTGKFDLVVGIKGVDISGIKKKVSGKAHGRLKVKKVPTSIRVTKFKFPKEIKAPENGKKVEVTVEGNLSFNKGSPGKRTVRLKLTGRRRYIKEWEGKTITDSDGSFSKTFKTRVYPPRRRCRGGVMPGAITRMGVCPVVGILPRIECTFPGTKDFRSSTAHATTKSKVIRVMGTRVRIRKTKIPGVVKENQKISIHVEGIVFDECKRPATPKDVKVYIWTKGVETIPDNPQGTITMAKNASFSGDVDYTTPKHLPRRPIICVMVMYPGTKDKCSLAPSDNTKCKSVIVR